ncbi:hypothetical protein JTE90_010961 [Oedothorax gibbosus]|uniref:BTB domain-containing protein n=1 Tax=Oedothorax gibbosus TaxID=931172 RepID=A0AAV6UCF0_9ARAC|nr:hypothetical protein JTE90_010961 [Oedothorax gibbosus]
MPSFPIYKCASITQIEVGRRRVTWPIVKIKNCVECKSKTAIQVDSALEDAPCFKVLLHFSDDSNCEYAQIEITQTKPFFSKINHFVKCKMAVMSAQKEYQHSEEGTFLFSYNTVKKWNFPEFLKIAYLVEDKYINLDDTLYLSCEFSFTHGDKVSHTEILTYDQEIFQAPKVSQVSHLTNTIQKLYLSKKFCDVNIQVGDESLPAQKLVLCAQSPVFCAMFENDMKEMNTNVVKIEDVETDTLKLMLEFLHSNVMKEGLSIDEILKLFSAADKYQISLLKYQCAILLLSLMTVENVCEILTVADRHHDDFLLASVHNFLKVHYVQVFHSSNWKTFLNEDPKLFGNVMIEVFQNS